mgnify:CR=1 FL=1
MKTILTGILSLPFIILAKVPLSRDLIHSSKYSPFTNGETFPLVIKNNTHLIGDSKYTTVLNAGANISKPRRVLEIFDGSQDVGNGWIADNIFVSGFTITGGYHIDDL